MKIKYEIIFGDHDTDDKGNPESMLALEAIREIRTAVKQLLAKGIMPQIGWEVWLQEECTHFKIESISYCKAGVMIISFGWDSRFG